jgi:hypothetical protein
MKLNSLDNFHQKVFSNCRDETHEHGLPIMRSFYALVQRTHKNHGDLTCVKFNIAATGTITIFFGSNDVMAVLKA